MYRMLIVEDEEIEREGLCELVDWEAMGILVEDAVESGEEALEIATGKDIDILFTDIRLPGMTGLLLAEKILEQKPAVKIIVTSCWEDFEYAKTAIDLDACGFLSKPINMKELKQVISKVTHSIHTENGDRLEKERLKKLVAQSLPILRNEFLNDFIHGIPDVQTINENLEYHAINFLSGLFVAIVYEMDDYERIAEDKGLEELHIAAVKVLECINGAATEDIAVNFSIARNRYCTIYNTAGREQDRLFERLDQYTKEIQEAINLSCGLTITIGIGKPVKEAIEIKASYRWACEAIKYKFFMGSNTIINYADINRNKSEDKLEDYEEIGKRILSSIELCNKEELDKYVAYLFDTLKNKTPYSDLYVRNVCINLLASCSVTLMDMNESYERIFGKESLVWEKILKFDTIYDIQQWIKNIFIGIIDYLLENRDSNNKKIIKDILKIIEEKYNTNLTIMEISKEVYLSSNYISAVFKKELGKNFTDYLIRYRLEKAKQLLKDSNYKVYQISSMVGYSNISHFCSIFKEFYGVSPNEFREKV